MTGCRNFHLPLFCFQTVDFFVLILFIVLFTLLYLVQRWCTFCNTNVKMPMIKFVHTLSQCDLNHSNDRNFESHMLYKLTSW